MARSGPRGPEPGSAPGTGSLQGRILEGTTETKFESPGARGLATLTRVTYKERKKVGGPHAMQRGIKRSWLSAPNRQIVPEDIPLACRLLYVTAFLGLLVFCAVKFLILF